MFTEFNARIRSLWRSIRNRPAVEMEMSEEFRLHLEMRAADLVRSGLSQSEALRRARLEFGSAERYKDEGRSSRGLKHVDQIRFSWLDFKLGFRMLARYPGLTVIGGLAMAFAIWVGAGSFELINQWINPSLPLVEGDRIVGLQLWDTAAGRRNGRALHDFIAWREELKSVEELSAFRTLERNLTDSQGSTEPVKVAEISAAAFRVARVPAMHGRFLDDSDENTGAPSVIVIGHDIWQTRFGADPGVIGRSIRLADTDTTVVGVMPKAFTYPVSHDVWIPFRLNAQTYERGKGPEIYVLGRLAAGISLEAADSELTNLGQRTAVDFPQTHAHLRPRILPYADSINPVPQDELYAMTLINVFVAMLVVLVCGNVGLLMFARAATREAEIVVRNALGASRKRIIVQLFSEALVLCSIGAVIGIAAARYGVRWGMFIIDLNVGRLPFWVDDKLSWTTLLYAVALTVMGAVIAGVVPALRMTRSVGAHLQQTTAGGGGVKFSGLWTVVIVAQVAVTVAFPVSVFFIRRAEEPLRSRDVGFASEQYLSAHLDLDSLDNARATYEELDRRLSAEGIVDGVTFANRLPRMLHESRQIDIVENDATSAQSMSRQEVNTASIAVDYIDVLNVQLLAGRSFNATDLDPRQQVVIVNRSFVERVLQGRNAIGRHLRFTNQPDLQFEIVGVVEDLAMNYLGKDGGEGIYQPLRGQRSTDSMYLVVKVRGEPASFTPRLRAVANAVDPTLRLNRLQPMNEMDSGVFKIFAIFSRVALVVSSVALLLSLAGIYAVMSFAVSRRTREIGIRVALGADALRVVFAVFRRPLAQVGIGVVIGGLAVAQLARLILGDLSAREVGFVIAYAAVMMAVCMLACVVPTRRALRVQPTEALRSDG